MSWTRCANGRVARLWPALMFLGAGLHFVSFDLVHQPIATDISFYLYYAARTAHGDLPYVDFFEHKTPLGIYAGAWLYQLGEALGVDPLYAIRAGYLLLAALTATVMGVIFARLKNNRPLAGWIGLFAFCGFGLLGVMPAAGNIPKMIGMLGAGLSMLAVDRRRWIWAGIWAGVAGLDWQPCGAAVGAGVLLAALCTSHRFRSACRAVVGMALPFLPVLAYFAIKGALGTFLNMIFVTSLTKASQDPMSFGDRCDMIFWMLGWYCVDEMWLAVAAGVGLLWFLVFLVRRIKTRRSPFLVGLACYHYGVIAFSLADFQGHGDLFIMEGSMAFFAGVTLVGLYYGLRRACLRFGGRRARASRPVLATAAMLALLVLVRPSFLRAGWRVNHPPIAPDGTTLSAQRDVAKKFFQVVGDGDVLLVRQQELLFLGKGTNCLGFVTWNQGTYSHLKQGDEDMMATFARLAKPADPDALIIPEPWLADLGSSPLGAWLLPDYRCLKVTSDDGVYEAYVWYRRTLPIPTVPGVQFMDPSAFRRVYVAPPEEAQ